MPDRLEEIEAMLRGGGTITYEIAAELFELTVTGRGTGISRAQAAESLRKRFPTEAVLTASMRAFLSQVDKMTEAPSGPMH